MAYNEIQSFNPISSRPQRWYEWFFIDWLGVFLIFFLYAGSRVPDVNEVHYWTKAAHFWNPEFASGDLFLSSGNAHWAFYFLFGSLTLWLPLENAVWVGRLVTWIAIAISWTFLCRGIFLFRNPICSSVQPHKAPPETDTPGFRRAITASDSPQSIDQPPIPATVLAALWLVGMEWGLWAGEWVVGGCESKGIAYAFLLGGLAALSRSMPLLGWSLLGLGCWFHVISGLWVTVTAALAILWISVVWNKQSFASLFAKHTLGLFLCAVGFTAGAIPAVLMDLGTPSDQATASAMEQVYNRLGHHLSPIKFSESRWSGFSILVISCFSLFLVTRQAFWRSNNESVTSTNDNPSGIRPHWIRRAPAAFQFMLLVCLAALGLSLFGLAFDLVFSHFAPKFASSILRFYWFRWNDVTLPLGFAMVSYAIMCGELNLNTPRAMQTRMALLCISGALIASLLFVRYRKNTENDIPAGEKQSFSLKSDSLETRLKQYEDWRAVCRWINENTEESALWLTPRRQQSFKWHTRRPELAVWKDMPQNAQAVVEWSSRLNDAYKFDKLKQLQPLSPQEIDRLVNKYQIRYVLLDLRVSGQSIPKDKQIYPNSTEHNDSFAVLKYDITTPDLSKASP